MYKIKNIYPHMQTKRLFFVGKVSYGAFALPHFGNVTLKS